MINVEYTYKPCEICGKPVKLVKSLRLMRNFLKITGNELKTHQNFRNLFTEHAEWR
jgi:hypothetical protein